jgi:hypothetical protein
MKISNICRKSIMDSTPPIAEHMACLKDPGYFVAYGMSLTTTILVLWRTDLEV